MHEFIRIWIWSIASALCAARQHQTAYGQEDHTEVGKVDGVEVLPHPVDSLDCTPSNYGLFRSMQHFFKGRRFK